MQQQASLSQWGESAGPTQPGTKRLARSPLRLAIAISIFLLCFGFTLYYAFLSPHPGFTFDVYWSVQDVVNCHNEVLNCGASQESLIEGDKIDKIGSIVFSEWFEDRRRNPFVDYEPGEIVPLEVIRDGERLAIDWQIPTVAPHTRAEAAIFPFLIYLPFWLVGSVALLLIKPHGKSWILFILLNYFTAMWLALGLSPSAPPPAAATLVHTLSWLMFGVYLHFHVLVPERIFKRSSRYLTFLYYAVIGVLIIFEVFKITPVNFYILAVFLAFVGSFILVAYQNIGASTVANKVVSRIMLSGVVLAFIPGLFLWLFPRLIGVNTGSLISIFVPIVAIATFPVFYLYAIYKKNLGKWEFWLNRFLYYYTLFLLIFSTLALVFLVATRWSPPSYDLSALFIIILAAALILFIPLQRRFQRFLDRLAFGSGESPEEIYRRFSTRIPASVDESDLKHIIESELLPNLGIQQSAVYLHSNSRLRVFHEYHVPAVNLPDQIETLSPLLQMSYQYIAPDSTIEGLKHDLEWVRLVIPLESHRGIIGTWLFGARYPDDFYSIKDIQMMDSLADQLAAAIENQRLIQEIKRELAERERAELQKQHFADRIALIHQIDQAILAAESKFDIAQAVIDRIPQLIPCSQAGVLLFHVELAEIETLALYKDSSDSVSQVDRHPLPELEDGFQEDASASVPAFDTDGSKQIVQILRSLIGEEAASLLAIPLTTAGRVIGAFYAASDNIDAFSEDHKEIAREVANSLAVAIQNRTLISKVNEHREELQRLSSQLLITQESERTKISQELHDEVGQLITAIFFDVAVVEKNLLNDSNPENQERLADANRLIEQLMEHVRSMSLELRPPMLLDLGLVPTLRWYLKNSAERLDVVINFDFHDIERRFSDDIETAFYRIVQEALTNAIRHGQADQIDIDLCCENSNLELQFFDDGIGFEPEQVFSIDSGNQGAGLLGIRERVANLGGTVTIKSEPDRGVSLQVSVPVTN